MSDLATRIGFDEALAIATRVAAARRLPTERIVTSRAQGRVLAGELHALVALPAFDNSAMDGFAVRHADLARHEVALRMTGEQFAGVSLGMQVGPGECVRVTTGAPMPDGADTVVMKENTRADGDIVRIAPGTRAGQHVRKAGEDVRVGDPVLAGGQVLTPARVALAAASGFADLEVSTRPTIAVFTTGDELVEPGLPLQPGQVYNSNRDLLMGLLREAGLEPTAWPTLPDDPARLQRTLLDAAGSFDLVLTCGAVSAGEKDHIPGLLQAHGSIHFWKVRMRPGMPLLFGSLGKSLFLGLPGNPVSVLATWLALGRQVTDAMQGREEARPRLVARLAHPWHKQHERLEFLRGHLRSSGDGVLLVEPNPADGSHRMRGAADSDALIVLPEGERRFAAGDTVHVLTY